MLNTIETVGIFSNILQKEKSFLKNVLVKEIGVQMKKVCRMCFKEVQLLSVRLNAIHFVLILPLIDRFYELPKV